MYFMRQPFLFVSVKKIKILFYLKIIVLSTFNFMLRVKCCQDVGVEILNTFENCLYIK